MILVDTSALYGFLDGDDARHQDAERVWKELTERGYLLVVTNYVLLEAFSLVQDRLGLEAARHLAHDIAPALAVEWVDAETHARGLGSLMAANRRDLSLVDCVSFEVMRRLGISRAYTLDKHFREQGFECMPAE